MFQKVYFLKHLKYCSDFVGGNNSLEIDRRLCSSTEKDGYARKFTHFLDGSSKESLRMSGRVQRCVGRGTHNLQGKNSVSGGS